MPDDRYHWIARGGPTGGTTALGRGFQHGQSTPLPAPKRPRLLMSAAGVACVRGVLIERFARS